MLNFRACCQQTVTRSLKDYRLYFIVYDNAQTGPKHVGWGVVGWSQGVSHVFLPPPTHTLVCDLIRCMVVIDFKIGDCGMARAVNRCEACSNTVHLTSSTGPDL